MKKSIFDPLWLKTKASMPWYDDPRTGLFIDDNALYVLKGIAHGYFRNASRGAYYMMMHTPFEWTHTEMIEFLVQSAEAYGLKLSDFNLTMMAIREEYTISPIDRNGRIAEGYEKAVGEYVEKQKKYEAYREKHDLPWGSLDKELQKLRPEMPAIPTGPYKWALDYIDQRPEEETTKLLLKLMSGQPFDLTDLNEMIDESHRHIQSSTNPNFEPKLRKEFFNKLLGWTSFNVDASPNLLKDLNAYLTLFEQGTLKPNQSSKFMAYKHWHFNPNLYTFTRHQELFIEELKKMESDYGSNFVMTNQFDDAIPFIDEGETILERYANRQFLFMHILFSFEHLGYLRIHHIYNNWNKHEEPRRYFVRIELLPTIYPLLGKEAPTDLIAATKPSAISLRYNDAGILYFNGKKMVLSPAHNSRQHYLLRALMKVKTKRLDADVAWKKMTGSDTYIPKTDWHKLHSVANAINLKAAAIIGLPDLIHTTKSELQVRQKYLI